VIDRNRSGPPFYLEPLDILPAPVHGQYSVVPILGGSAVALSVAVWRPGTSVPRTVLAASALPNWLNGLEEEEHARATCILRRWRTAPEFPGISKGVEARPALMGVVNLTNDSFYASSRQPDVAAATGLGRRLAAEGASVLDIGGQSTRPGSSIIASSQELASVLPVIAGLASGTEAAISIDTIRPAVAEAAVRTGATIVNDVSGLMPASALGDRAGLIIGHMRGNPTTMQKWPRSERSIFSLYDWLERRISALVAAGIGRERIAIDPGFGFGKSISHNRTILKHLPLLTGLGVAIAIGLSRKASLGFVSGAPSATERLPASLAAALTAAHHGAAILRVHDVAATRQALQTQRFFR
jgi:dihydropteroate synthase